MVPSSNALYYCVTCGLEMSGGTWIAGAGPYCPKCLPPSFGGPKPLPPDYVPCLHSWGIKVNCPTVRKVWGEEQIVVNTPQYCGKRMLLNMGYRCSLHMHKLKDETFFVESGMMYVELEHPDGKKEAYAMNPGDFVRVKPGTWHRFTGLVNTVFYEFSTHHEDDDSYRREPSGQAPYHNA